MMMVEVVPPAWHLRKTRGSLHVTVDHTGAVTLTTVLRQTRTVTSHDYSPHLSADTTSHARPVDAEPPPVPGR